MRDTNRKEERVSGQPCGASAGSIASGHRARTLVGILCASLLALLFASSASAKVVELYTYNGAYPAGSFDGTGSVGGPAPFPACNESLDIHQASGNVFVGNCESGGSIYKFDSAGVPQAYSALAPNTVITGAPTNGLGRDDRGQLGHRHQRSHLSVARVRRNQRVPTNRRSDRGLPAARFARRQLRRRRRTERQPLDHGLWRRHPGVQPLRSGLVRRSGRRIHPRERYLRLHD